MNQSTDYILLKEQGDQRRDAGELQAALTMYEEAITRRPQFWGAHYEKGDVLLRLNKPIEAASAFMTAWLYSRFRKEPALMCGRSLLFGKLNLEACLVFEKIPQAELDPYSALMYAEALRKEGRVREAMRLIPLFKNFSDTSKNRVMGALNLEMGEIDVARQYLEAALPSDRNGYCYDHLIGAYYAGCDHALLRDLLQRALLCVGKADYYGAQLAVLDILECRPSSDQEARHYGEWDAIVDSARYIQPYVFQGCRLTGTTYQTFDIVKDLVPERGLILEFGVRNGHTIHRLAEMFPQRELYGFDSFEGLPEIWNDEDAGSYTTLGRLPKVPANVEFVIGWFSDTLPNFKVSHPEPIAFMNIDCDIYSATKTIFDELDLQILSGTIIVFDEYLGNKSWREDEFKAFQEWVAVHGVKYEYLAASFCTKQAAIKILSRK